MGLKLSRKPGESVRLLDNRHGTEIIITVCERSGGNVELLFDAPQYVKVLRTEIPLRETPPLGALNNPELPQARWRENSGRKFAKRRQ